MDTSFVQDQNQIRKDYKEDDDKYKQRISIRGLFCTKTSKGLIFITIFAISIPLLTYYFVIDRGNYSETDIHSCAVERDFRIVCGEANATANYCSRISCCFDNSTQRCYHYLPSKYYYQLSDVDDTKTYRTSQTKNPFNTASLSEIAVTVNEIDANRVQIILHETNATVDHQSIVDKNYNVIVYDALLSVEVYRGGTGELLLTTSKGPLIASSGYWEWSFHLTDDYLFGFGETLIKVEENSTLTKVIYKNKFDHNTVPVFMAHRAGRFHGLIVGHTGPLEVTVLPSNLVSVKTLVGAQLTFELSLGPTPKDVLSQQKAVQATLPPYWALGTHICREGTAVDINDVLDEYDEFLSKNADLQYTSDCIHNNLFMMMYDIDAAQKARLIAAINGLTDNNKTFILSLPPHIVADTTLHTAAENLDLLYKDQDSNVYRGSYMGKNVVYPDYNSQDSLIDEYISILFSEIEANFGTDLHRLTLVDNWPVDDSFTMLNKTDEFPYLSEELIAAMSLTLPWNTKTGDTLHLINHNDYGTSQAEHLSNSSDTDGVYLMSASYNSNIRSPSIIENIDISWSNLKQMIRTVLYNSLYGNPLVSVPVCGSTDTYNQQQHESLCMRWYLMAATMPIFRISSDLPRRDPNALFTAFAVNAAKDAIAKRDMLLPYYYTILSRNEPLLRPMFYNFHEDANTFDLDGQYMIGDRILVAQPLVPDKSKLNIYLPPAISVWYELWGGFRYQSNNSSSLITLDIVETDWISFIAAGSVLPLMAAVTEEGADVNLIIALSCNESFCTANGSLLLGSAYLEFSASALEIMIDGITDNAKTGMECFAKQFIIRKISLYNDEVLTYGKNVNLCDADSEQMTIPFQE